MRSMLHSIKAYALCDMFVLLLYIFIQIHLKVISNDQLSAGAKSAQDKAAGLCEEPIYEKNVIILNGKHFTHLINWVLFSVAWCIFWIIN